MTLLAPLRAPLLAGTLALTAAVSAPAPANAIDENAARILAGLVALGIVAKVIDDRNDRRDEKRASASARDQRPDLGRHRDVRERRRPIVEPGHGFRGRVLPAGCLRDVTGGARGVRRLMGAECLQRRDVRAVLPARCATRVFVGGRDRRAYGARCLRRAGYDFR